MQGGQESVIQADRAGGVPTDAAHTPETIPSVSAFLLAECTQF